jgi:hypothetical protein
MSQAEDEDSKTAETTDEALNSAAYPNASVQSALEKNQPAPRLTGMQRLIKNIDRVCEKTKVDLEACRQVVSKVLSKQEGDLDKMSYTSSPRAFTPPKPSPIKNFKNSASCGSSWENMSGTDCIRLCDKCQLFVYDFKDKEKSEVDATVFRREGKENASFWKRIDGTFMTTNCPIGAKKRIRTLSVLVLASALPIFGIIGLCLFSAPSAVPSKTAQLSSPGAASSLAQKSERPSKPSHPRIIGPSSYSQLQAYSEPAPPPSQQRSLFSVRGGASILAETRGAPTGNRSLFKINPNSGRLNQ